MTDVEAIERETRVPAVVVDELGMITSVNEAFAAAFGWTATDLVGKSLTTIIPDHLHDAHNLGFSRFLLTGHPTLLGRPLKLGAKTKAGEIVDAEHTIFAERRSGRWIFGATIRPSSS